ncbi:late embryogenesis abundant protein At1g64065-like [Rhododendron vialii]|uniref:late embryogenesis abundant protein At1g64065-like n=1 Tax=Rhododendron vialii TaxID=182163 RepID=UPI00265DA920|nr:late embryogenesis abundant protein At1g64065-like [Rhododendron vialii]
MHDKELRREKRKKWLLYSLAFIIFQSAIIALFTLTVMKVRSPKFLVRSATFDTFDIQSTTNPLFSLRTNIVLAIKNANFGPYKYDNSTVYFYYGNTEVGSAIIPKSKAQFRRTKKFTVGLDLASTNLAGNSQLATDISSGIVPLSSRSTLTGKVELMLIFKKKKSVNMNCTMEINTNTQMLQNVVCK